MDLTPLAHSLKRSTQPQNNNPMKQFITLLTVMLIAAGCNSVKKTSTAVHSGDYTQAIQIAQNKLRKNPENKRKQPYVLLLEEAFAKVVQRDQARIAFLKKENNPAQLGEIFSIYKNLRFVQEGIRPLLPLQILKENRNAQFKFVNYDNELLATKTAYTNYLYSNIQSDIAFAKAKQDFRAVYRDMEYLNSIAAGFKEIKELMKEVHFKGTDYVKVDLYNDTEMLIPVQLENDLLDFSTYGLNDFWTEYHSARTYNITYDYGMDVSLREINISPERIREREIHREKEIVDGTEYIKDDNGNFILDKEGNKIKRDTVITVHCDFYEYNQFKAVNVVGQVRYKNLQTGNLIKSFPLVSEFIFENTYGEYDGDKRALEAELRNLLKNSPIAFPTNEQMVYDAGEDLKNNLKRIIQGHRF
ncbi:MAG: hypothetical protein ACI828_001239 [Flavobacteriales bacterium]|jgi:hypothetical protein